MFQKMSNYLTKIAVEQLDINGHKDKAQLAKGSMTTD
jgi:hypothetical protein